MALTLGLTLAQSASAVTVYYQPTPYPLWKYGSTPQNPLPMPQDLSIVHIHDGWMNSSYTSLKPFQRTDTLRIGGWSDSYTGYINFDLTGLPSNVNAAMLWLMPYTTGGTPTGIDFWYPELDTPHFPLNGGIWNTSMTWDTQPPIVYPQDYYGWKAAPVAGTWWGANILTPYNAWKSGMTNRLTGFRLESWLKNNNFDNFWSSRYTANDGLRPLLAFDITPSIQLKMPLPGGYSWLLTTEIGGYDCRGKMYSSNGTLIWPDSAHQGLNYFSIDLSPTDSGYPTNIPILAAAGGKVIQIGTDQNAQNGYFIVIDHDGDGNANTGIQTRYLHLNDVPRKKPVPPATQGVALIAAVNGVGGDTVAQGDQIGVMGNSGASDGTHLHFGVRYADSGVSTLPELAKVVMEGKILKSYQTECSVDTNGVPLTWIRRYPSTLSPTGN